MTDARRGSKDQSLAGIAAEEQDDDERESRERVEERRHPRNLRALGDAGAYIQTETTRDAEASIEAGALT